MADSNLTGGLCSPPAASVAEDDALLERAVVSLVLEEHPDQATVAELGLALGAGPDDFAATDAVERAVRELVGAGVLRECAGLISPTRAALYLTRLRVEL